MTEQIENEPTRHGKLWSLLDWSFWGAGMGDVFRMPLADTMLAAVPVETIAQAEQIMADFIERRKIAKTGVTIYPEQRAELEQARARAQDALNLSVEDGREVCADCGKPVADGPCAVHSPDAVFQRQAKEAAGLRAQRDQARRIAVTLEQENARLEDELTELKALHDPRLRGLLVKTAPDKDQYVLWSTVCDMPGGVFSRETALAYGFPRSKVDWADEHGSSSRLGDGAWDDKGWVAEQRGWLRRDLIGDYAVEYLHGDRIAAYALLEPLNDDSEAQPT